MSIGHNKYPCPITVNYIKDNINNLFKFDELLKTKIDIVMFIFNYMMENRLV